MQKCLCQLKNKTNQKITIFKDFAEASLKPHYISGFLFIYLFNGSDDTTLDGSILNKTL